MPNFRRGIYAAVYEGEQMDDAQAVIFDRDGVLTQFNPASALQHINRVLPVSLDALLQHWQAYGSRVGFPATAAEETSFFRGLWHELAQEYGLADDARAWLLTFDYTQHMALYPDVIPLLTALKARDIKTGVLSNFTLATLDRSLEVLGIAQWIDTACAATVIGAAKPDAAAYLTVAATLDVPPERCLFFDDEPACVRGAQQTGMRAWLVDRTGHNTDTTLPSVRGLDEVLGLCGVR